MNKFTKNNFEFDNYYIIFDIIKSSSTKQIISAYENKIIKFNNIKQLSQNQINEIKSLKKGLYILTNPQLRIIYDKILNPNTDLNIGPIADNFKQSDTFDTLDSLFNIDNSWMDKEIKEEYIGKKNKNETNIVNDRIFNFSEFNKRPNFSSDLEAELRKPQQGRIEKSQ